MARIAAALCLALVVAMGVGHVVAKDDAKLAAARKLVATAIEPAEFERLIKQTIRGFSRDVVRQAGDADDRVVLRVLMEQAGVVIADHRAEYLEGIAQVYARHLSAADLKAAVAFFESPAGKRWMKVQEKLLEDTVGLAVGMGDKLKPQIVEATLARLERDRRRSTSDR